MGKKTKLFHIQIVSTGSKMCDDHKRSSGKGKTMSQHPLTELKYVFFPFPFCLLNANSVTLWLLSGVYSNVTTMVSEDGSWTSRAHLKKKRARTQMCELGVSSCKVWAGTVGPNAAEKWEVIAASQLYRSVTASFHRGQIRLLAHSLIFWIAMVHMHTTVA